MFFLCGFRKKNWEMVVAADLYNKSIAAHAPPVVEHNIVVKR